MKNLRKTTLLLFTTAIAATIIFSSCDDDESFIIDKNVLTSGTWEFEEAKTGDLLATIAISSLFSGSEYTFNTDNTYTGIGLLGIEEISGTWKLEDDVLILDEGESDEVMYQITGLSSEKLKLFVDAYTDDDGDKFSEFTLIYYKGIL